MYRCQWELDSEMGLTAVTRDFYVWPFHHAIIRDLPCVTHWDAQIRLPDETV